MLLTLARSRKLLFFGGKGGVGKTTVSAATALARAGAGARVLLVSTDPAHSLGHLFERPVGPAPVRIAPGLDALELDPERTVTEHIREVAGALRRLMPVGLHGEVDRHMRLSQDAPGMQEAAMLERVAEVAETGAERYDLVVFDTAPSGHTARLMALPEMMSAWTDGLIERREKADRFAEFVRGLGRDTSMQDRTVAGDGDGERDRDDRIRRTLARRRRRFAGLRDRLSDPAQSSFVIVLAAERLPVLETVELHRRLERAGISVDGLVVNRRTPGDQGAFLAQRRRQEEGHLVRLDRELPGIARQEIPLAARDIVGLAALERLAAGLRAGPAEP